MLKSNNKIGKVKKKTIHKTNLVLNNNITIIITKVITLDLLVNSYRNHRLKIIALLFIITFGVKLYNFERKLG